MEGVKFGHQLRGPRSPGLDGRVVCSSVGLCGSTSHALGWWVNRTDCGEVLGVEPDIEVGQVSSETE